MNGYTRRDLAIEAAVYTMIRFAYPDLTVFQINNRTSTQARAGKGHYFVLFDGIPTFKVTLNGPREFSITVLP
jgi:hypothetical protein